MCPYLSMDNSRIIALMAKKMGKSASPEELEELEGLLRAAPGYGYLSEIVGALKGNQEHREEVVPREELASHGWQGLSERMSEDLAGGEGTEGASGTGMRWSLLGGGILRRMSGVGVRRVSGDGKFGAGMRRVSGFGKSRAAAAAVLAVAIGVGGWFWAGRGAGKVEKEVMPLRMMTATAGYGATTKLVLSDGTKVWLNAGSKLIYPERFGLTGREVELEGEAFFDVAGNVKAPFSVHARRIRIGVLGTSFNVKAYAEDAEIETTLISGKVQVTLDHDPEKKILLSPHEKLTIGGDEDEDEEGERKDAGAAKRSYHALHYQVQALPKDTAIAIGETAWLKHRLVISDESFENVAHMLERKYDVEVRFEDEVLKSEHLSGVFERESIGRVLQILQMTTGFRYRMEGRTIWVSKTKTII